MTRPLFDHSSEHISHPWVKVLLFPIAGWAALCVKLFIFVEHYTPVEDAPSHELAQCIVADTQAWKTVAVTKPNLRPPERLAHFLGEASVQGGITSVVTCDRLLRSNDLEAGVPVKVATAQDCAAYAPGEQGVAGRSYWQTVRVICRTAVGAVR
jgi:hypothetical protein